MKTKLLFIMPSLSAGGGEKSLINLLSVIDYEHYEVDLFLFQHEGLFMEYIPKEVRLLPLPTSYQEFSQSIFHAMISYLLRGKPKSAYDRVKYSLINRRNRHPSINEQLSWRYVSSYFPYISQNYDAAIGFLEKTSNYFCVDKVHAKRKIGWIHNDYDKLGMDPMYDIKYFKRLDHIVTVSEECENVLVQRFPCQKEKISLMYNIVSPTMIQHMAEDLLEEDEQESEVTQLLTIGRLHEQKGYEIAIQACYLLVQEGYNVRWKVIGEGEERSKLNALIESYGLQNHFQLIGLRKNPYPYIRQADIYVQTSKYEGKSIAIDEAKILNKPIVVTNFSTAKDQIENGVDGFIVEMNAIAIADGIKKLINDETLKDTFRYNLSQQCLGTEEEIMKLYEMVGGKTEEKASIHNE